MSERERPKIVADDVVVSMSYKLTVDGELIDSTEGEDPIQYLQGHGEILPGLEQALQDMAIGERKVVVVAPKDGYGEIDPSQIVDVPRSEFPDEIPVEEGVELEVKDKQGNVMSAMITKVRKDGALLDFNHPLAGKELHFEIHIVDLRAATDEEIDHGHVHEEEDHEH